MNNQPGSNERNGQPPVDILLSQGFRDALFNVNDAWWNYQCAAARGGDVRLLTHQNGHILSSFVPAPGPFALQEAAGKGKCGSRDREQVTLDWFRHKLLGEAESAALTGTDENLCISLADGDAVDIPPAEFLARKDARAAIAAGQSAFTSASAQAENVVIGAQAQALSFAAGLGPNVVPLFTVAEGEGAILAGIPQADITVSTPAGVQDLACQAGLDQKPTIRTGCDSIVFVGLGVQRAGSSEWENIDEQAFPVRGLGTHTDIDLVGVAERLNPGDRLALLVYGHHSQYIASYSRDPSIPLVNVSAELRLPLYASDAQGLPDFGRAASEVLLPASELDGGCTDPTSAFSPACAAQGTAIHGLRTLCEYVWAPELCALTNTDVVSALSSGAQT